MLFFYCNKYKRQNTAEKYFKLQNFEMIFYF